MTETTTEKTGVAGWSDESIARRLRDTGDIQGSQYDCFVRRLAGESFRDIASTGPLNPLTGKRYHHTAIEDWINYVIELLRLARELEIPIEQERSCWGIWIDQSHMVRLAANRTPERVSFDGVVNAADVRPQSHFPDADRMKASGKKPR